MLYSLHGTISKIPNLKSKLAKFIIYGLILLSVLALAHDYGYVSSSIDTQSQQCGLGNGVTGNQSRTKYYYSGYEQTSSATNHSHKLYSGTYWGNWSKCR
jgi:hypothetical protein